MPEDKTDPYLEQESSSALKVNERSYDKKLTNWILTNFKKILGSIIPKDHDRRNIEPDEIRVDWALF